MVIEIKFTPYPDGSIEAISGNLTVYSAKNESFFMFKKRVELMILASLKINLYEAEN